MLFPHLHIPGIFLLLLLFCQCPPVGSLVTVPLTPFHGRTEVSQRTLFLDFSAASNSFMREQPGSEACSWIAGPLAGKHPGSSPERRPHLPCPARSSTAQVLLHIYEMKALLSVSATAGITDLFSLGFSLQPSPAYSLTP